MEVLKCSIDSEQFLKLQCDSISIEDIHFIIGGQVPASSLNRSSSGEMFGRDDLLTLKSKGFQKSSSPSRETKGQIYSFIEHKTRKQVEIEYVLSLEPVCAKNTIYYNGQFLNLVAYFDGLDVRENQNKKACKVWVCLEECEDSTNVINFLNNKQLSNLAKILLYYFEHLLLVSNTETLLVTACDSRLEKTDTVIYRSSSTLRFELLEFYFQFTQDLQERKSKTKERNT